MVTLQRFASLSFGYRLLTLLAIFGFSLLFSAEVWASSSNVSLDFASLLMGLFGGLAIFLYGMEKMSTSLKLVAGERMKTILAKLTVNRIMGMMTGAFVTAIIQSSSVTTVLLVGFVSAELMTLAQAIGVIFGANIGTTITAQVIAFKVTKYALWMITSGFLVVAVGKNEKTRQYGHLLLGLGMVFFGMGLMSEAMQPLRSFPPFMDLMQTVSNPLVGVAVAAGFTALVQSSSATTGVILALAMQGLVSLEGGIALTLGANIGTCVTAGLASIGKPREAVRVAIAHTTFNVMGAFLVVGFIPWFADLVRHISPVHPELTGLEQLAAEVPRQVANAHTIFNLTMAVVFLPFTGLIARFCMMVAPDRPEGDKGIKSTGYATTYTPRYLDSTLLSTPSIALSMVRREISVLVDLTEKMIKDSFRAIMNDDREMMDALKGPYSELGLAHGYLTQHLSKMGSRNLPRQLSDELLASLAVIIEIKYVGDVIKHNMHQLIEISQEDQVDLDAHEQETLEKLHSSVVWSFRSATAAYLTDNQEAADMVIEMKDSIVSMDMEFRANQIKMIHEDGENIDLSSYTLYMEVLDLQKRIFYHAKRIAQLERRERKVLAWLSPSDQADSIPVNPLTK
ncbi:MAG: Na/Pi cotransporter family protein [Magnetococcales bacterium]|nr:Na/Pi cotransporter family protein [Magnetococcales bacterium]